MQIYLNDKPFEFDGRYVQDLIDTLQKESNGVAVAIDQNIIPRSAWETTDLLASCRVFIFESIAGG
ncbi:sulfur carrier protein ThiS [Marinomonas aquiplantarum]|uniref:Sulfur carrier protein ThiS n=1 Tax=Marinomonas aquiplantarum TaxID=491951 RepID=A0A366CYF7_9GAMM|nr:sulfur carrier protein ThiS [Marinomonas aquiplantarum]RBO82696.1 sulfur carrier protein ThiS [Marinomonas aquiplantarum]